MSFGQSFVTLFTEMNIATAILLVCGLILVTIEFFEPGISVFGIAGGVCLLAAIIVQLVKSDFNFVQAIILFILVVFILAVVFLIVALLIKRGFIARSSFVQNETALPADGKTQGTEDFSFLIGKAGITKTFLRPIGKAEFEGREYDVVAYQGAAYKTGTKVAVIEVEGQRIVVKAN